MRLLNVLTRDVEEFHGTAIPPYAILSHTWGPEEVTLLEVEALARYRRSHEPPAHLRTRSADSPDTMKLMLLTSMLMAFRGDRARAGRPSTLPALTNGNGSDDEDGPLGRLVAAATPHPLEQKAGYAKIAYACGQAQKDGYRYLWVDTCCIDRRSSAELTEAVNSMFAWYQRAAVCYVYLDDVLVDDYTEGYRTWKDFFNGSRWFTRGWTLQELLAPRKVVFYAKGWRLLGTKSSLVKQIEKITGIDELALLEPNLVHNASVAQRMSWAANRATTRPEDVAYSLMGLFGVNMPVLYGEGDNAFLRLQEEIIKRSDDHSIFAWGALGQDDDQLPLRPPELDDLDYDALTGTTGVLAKSPRDFAGMGHVLACPPLPGLPDADYALTNKGLHITLPLTTPTSPSPAGPAPASHLAILNCHPADDPSSRLALLLTPTALPGTLLRTRTRTATLVSATDLAASPAKARKVYIPSDAAQLAHAAAASSSSSSPAQGSSPSGLCDEAIFVRAPDLVAPGYDVLDVRGAGALWNAEYRSIRLAGVDYHQDAARRSGGRGRGAPPRTGVLYQLAVVTFWNRVLKCGFVARVLVDGVSRVCFVDLVPGVDGLGAAEEVVALARRVWERPGTVEVVVPAAAKGGDAAAKRVVTVDIVNAVPSGGDDGESAVTGQGKGWSLRLGHEVRVAASVTFAEKWEKEYRRTVHATVERRKKGVIELKMSSMLWQAVPTTQKEELDQPS